MNGEPRRSGGWETVLDAECPLTPGAEWRSELYRMAVEQFTRSADLLGIEPEIRTRLLEPHRALIVNFPVRSDSGEVSSFTGYRVQHTLAMGPVKGGVRYGPGVSLGRVRRAGDVDDLQMRLARSSVQRREGRRPPRAP